METFVRINSNQTLESFIRDGKVHKTFKEYYWNQALCLETTYIGYAKNGYMKKWYPSGVLKKHIEYTDNKMNGIFRRWYENKQLLLSGEYSQGKRVGIWKYWKKDGSLDRERTYSAK